MDNPAVPNLAWSVYNWRHPAGEVIWYSLG